MLAGIVAKILTSNRIKSNIAWFRTRIEIGKAGQDCI